MGAIGYRKPKKALRHPAKGNQQVLLPDETARVGADSPPSASAADFTHAFSRNLWHLFGTPSRHKLRVAGTARFGFEEVYGEMCVLDLYQKRPRSPAHALS